MLDWLRKKLLSDSTPPATQLATRGKRPSPAADATQYQLLESRQLMATLLSSSAVSYQDIDGDRVTVNFSRGFLTAGNVNSIFQFNTGSVNGSNAARQQLLSLNLGSVPSARRTSITTSVTSGGGGGFDAGVAHVGQIMAEGIDLGNVTISGNLGRIRAGDSNARSQALGTLTVNVLGDSGTPIGAANFESETNGSTGGLNIRGSVLEGFFRTQNGGQIGSINIGGSLFGGSRASSGRIFSSGNIGDISISGSLFGDSGAESGRITAEGSIGNVTVGGSVFGGGGIGSGALYAAANLSSLTVRGSISGIARSSGSIQVGNIAGNITIGGDLRGGSGEYSGVIMLGNLDAGRGGALRIGGNILGGSGQYSGSLYILDVDRAATIDVEGRVAGGSGPYSGMVICSGTKLERFTVGGRADGLPAALKGLSGSGQFNSGYILLPDVTTLSIAGDVLGGSSSTRNFRSGAIVAGNVTNLTVGGNLVGGNASGSADVVFCGGIMVNNVTNLVLGGSLLAGVDSTSGSYLLNGAILSKNAIDNLTIGGDVRGNSSNSAIIAARGQIRPRGSANLAIGTINVAGNVERASIKAGALGGAFTDVSDNADAQIGSVTVGGSWIASELGAGTYRVAGDRYEKVLASGTEDSSRRFSRIGSITIGGSVRGSSAAGDRFGFVAEEIGRVRIGGSELALTAGRSNDNRLLDSVFGDTKLFEY